MKTDSQIPKTLEKEEKRGEEKTINITLFGNGGGKLEKDKSVGRGRRRKPEIGRGSVCHQSHGSSESLVSTSKACLEDGGGKDWWVGK